MKRISTLKKNYEFKKVLNSGNYYRGKYVTVYIKNNNTKKNKIGIAIGKKIAKATKRNRLKRLIRESYRLSKDKIKVGYNIVFIWNKQASPLNNKFNEVNNDILNIFKKADLINE